MKYVGVSAPAWTIPGRKPEPEPAPKLTEDLHVVDSDALSKKHLYPNVPGVVFVTPHPRPPQPEPTEEQKQKLKELTDIPEKNFKKKSVFPKSERFDSGKMSLGPGPGSYQHDLTKSITGSMPNFSFGYKHETMAPAITIKEGEEVKESEPVHGIYYPQYKHREFASSVKLGKPHKNPNGLNLLAGSCAPGPGFYKIPEIPGNTSSTKGTFSKARREGLYSSSNSLDEHAMYDVNQHTIAYRAERIVKYEQDRTKYLHKSISEKKLPTSANTERGMELFVPAPIRESPKKSMAKKVGTFGTGLRPELNGPAQYDLGPGEYFNMTKSKATLLESLPKIGRAQRKPLNDNNDLPGPGTYFTNPEADDKLGQSIFKKWNNPGGPAFTMRGKFEMHGSKDTYRQPGPGQYEFDHIYGIGWSRGKGNKFGTELRPMEKLVNDVTGPGMYEINRDLGSSEGIKFPKSKRPPMANNTDKDIDIGPNHYNLKSTIPQLQDFEMLRMNQNENYNNLYLA